MRRNDTWADHGKNSAEIMFYYTINRNRCYFPNGNAIIADGPNLFDPINENVTNSTGNTVEEIVKNSSDFDPAGTKGDHITVTSVDNTNGKWQYLLNGGIGWQDITSQSGSVVDISANALLLDQDARIRFIPNTDWNGTATIKYKEWQKESAGIQLDGVDDFIAASGLSTYDNVTFESWIRMDSFSDNFNVLLNADSWSYGDLHIQFFKGNPTKLEIAVNGASVYPRFDYDFNTRIGKWTHLAVTVERSTGEYKLYINGDYVETKYATGVPQMNLDSFTIGGWNWDGNGSMTD
jgi:hypothetical protein